MSIRFVPVLSAAIATALASTAFAGPGPGGGWTAFRDPTVQDFGHQWSRVGDPHNSPFVYDDPSPFVPPVKMGRTNYKYRIMTREVTVGEWFEFVEAYAPYVSNNAAGSQQLTGSLIHFDGFAGGVPQYHILGDNDNVPVAVGWRFAARFANWLNADKADEASAFESGVYDTSTFGTTQNDQGINVLTDQQARSEGARYFIPTTDEWKKAGHWDPNRYGEGEGGYWLYPTTSDTAPIAASPEFGGETNGGPFPPGQMRPLDVGSYPDVQSPWGLLDVSGGAHEWMEDITNPSRPQSRFAGGTSIYGPSPTAVWDHLTALGAVSPTLTFSGVRLASVIPSPSPIVLLAVGFSCFFRRHRHDKDSDRMCAGPSLHDDRCAGSAVQRRLERWGMGVA